MLRNFLKMKRICLLLPLFAYFLSCSAQEGNNWVFGLRAGITFSEVPAKPFSSSIFSFDHSYPNDSFTSLFPQSISDCNGDLMYYVGGDSMVWNRGHKLLPSIGLLKFNKQSNFFIPLPGNDSFMYLFQFPWGNGNKKLCYTVINNYLDSGRGDIVEAEVQFSDSSGAYAGYIKHANGIDYWVMVKTSDYTMHSYLFSSAGISKKPVISLCKGFTNGSGGGNYPYLRSSNNGNFVISTYTDKNTTVPFYIYNFDRYTGKLSNGRVLIPKSTNYKRIIFSFSPNDSIIYAILTKPFVTTPDTNYVYQLRTYDSLPFNNAKIVFRIPIQQYKYGYRLSQLGQDNRLYIDISSEQYRTISYIKYPDIWGEGCVMVYDGMTFPVGTAVHSQNFPCHSYPVKRIANKFDVSGADGCGYDTARFTFDGDSAFTYFRWYFGDGDSADGRSVLHQYAQPGSYYVRLACTLGPCGYRQWVGDSVHIKFKPNISIAPASTYTCGKNTLDLAISYRLSDTLRLWLNGLDTTFAVTNSNQSITINHKFTTDTSGTFLFAAKATNAQCSDSAASVHSAFIDPAARAVFQTNNPASCGSSTFTFSDTSGLDNIVVKRRWDVRGQMSDTSIYSSQNTLNITLSDTGKYTVTLTQTTRQGCVDSLTKPDFVWMHPLPESVVLVDGKMVNYVNMCFGDTALLSVIAANAGILKYQWSNGDTTKTLRITKPGTFSVKVWDEWNCYATSEPVQLKWLPELKVTLYKTTDSLLAKPNRAVVTYEWYRNGNLASGISHLNYLYHADSGTYQIIVTDSNDCTATSNYQKFYWTGFAQLQITNEELRIYPNPANTTLYLSALNSRNSFIRITDIAGKQIQTANNNGESTVPLNIEYLASGVYILEVAGQHVKFVKE